MPVLGKKIVTILLSIPDPDDRAFLAGRVIRLVCGLEPTALQIEENAAHKVAEWIDCTWPSETVRAKHSQKIARMVRAGDWKTPG